MREFEFDLSKYENITGKLILEIPSYRERLKMIKECKFNIKDQNVTVNTELVDSTIKMLDVTEKYFKKVSLKCGNITVKSFEEMESYSEFDDLLVKAATTIINAGKLGK